MIDLDRKIGKPVTAEPTLAERCRGMSDRETARFVVQGMVDDETVPLRWRLAAEKLLRRHRVRTHQKEYSQAEVEAAKLAIQKKLGLLTPEPDQDR